MPKEPHVPQGDQRRRQSPRFPFVASLKARCSSWKSFHQLFSHNVSATGLFVPSDEDAQIGEAVEVMLHAPDKTVIRLEGEVAHLRPSEDGRPPGLGIHITGVADEDKVRYLEMVSKASEQCEVRPAVPAPFLGGDEPAGAIPAAPPRAPKRRKKPDPNPSETSDNLQTALPSALETTMDSISVGDAGGAAFLPPLNPDAMTTAEQLGIDDPEPAAPKKQAAKSPRVSDEFAPDEFFEDLLGEDPATAAERRSGRGSDGVVSDSVLFNNDYDGLNRVPTDEGVGPKDPEASDSSPDERPATTTLDSLSPITDKEIEEASGVSALSSLDEEPAPAAQESADMLPALEVEVEEPDRKPRPTSTSLKAIQRPAATPPTPPPGLGSPGAPPPAKTPPPTPPEAPTQARPAAPPAPPTGLGSPGARRGKAPPPPPVTPEMPKASGEGIHKKPRPAEASRKRMPIVAIDFGTSRSSVAVVQNRQINVLRLPNGAWDIASVVGFLPNGSVVLGDEARAMLGTDPKNAINSPKRLLGRYHRDRELEPYLANLAMIHSEAPNRGIRLHAYSRNYSIEQVCAPIIYQLRLTAETALGGKIERAVFTTPVSFDDRRYAALERAADLAGVKVLEFVDEPTAAALCHRFEPSFKGLVAVYDFGGGTFDFSVVEASAADVQVVATAGDVWLGGDDFDDVLANAAANAFWREHKLELRHQAVQWQRLLVAAEHAKRELSYKESATIHIKEVALTAAGPKDLNFAVTRAEFSKLAAPIIQRSLDTCHEALELSDIKKQELSAVYLSGGTAYIPAVREGITRHFGLAPTSAVPPERAVVTGAAVYAALLRAGSISAE